MKRLIFAAIPIALVACRGIVGIEDLTVDDGGTSHDGGTQGDAAQPQDGGQPPQDSGGGPETGNGCSAQAHDPCLGCCMQNNPSDVMVVMSSGGVPCLCTNPGPCKTQCANFTCAQPPNMTMDPTCGQCQTNAFIGTNAASACGNVVAQCAGSTCKNLVECAASCPK